MFFGLSNASVSFQRYINKILIKKLDIFVIVYLDDILIYTKKIDQLCVNVVYEVLEQLQKNSLYINFKKCNFHQDKIQFLRFVVLVQGIQIKEK